MNVFLMFYPLFRLPFDSVTIMFKNTPGFIGLQALNVGNFLDESLGIWALEELTAFINHSVYYVSRHQENFWRPLHRHPVRASPGGLLGAVSFLQRGDFCGNTNFRSRLPKTKRIAIGYDAPAPEDQGNAVQLTGICCAKLL